MATSARFDYWSPTALGQFGVPGARRRKITPRHNGRRSHWHSDKSAGEIPKAFVVPKHAATLDAAELMPYVAARVAPYKKVRGVEFVDQIPKSATGKILRRVLRERVPAQLDRKPL